jgi:hypothetical protein
MSTAATTMGTWPAKDLGIVASFRLLLRTI